jgi:hypothetical protein
MIFVEKRKRRISWEDQEHTPFTQMLFWKAREAISAMYIYTRKKNYLTKYLIPLWPVTLNSFLLT